MSQINKNISERMPIPLLIINEQGKVISANEKISDVFLYDGIVNADVFTLTGVKMSTLTEACETGQKPEIERNGKIFRLTVYKCDRETGDMAVIFADVTPFKDLAERYNAEKPFCIKVEIDNYDELINPTGGAPKLEVSSDIDKTIRSWFDRFRASVTRVTSSKYIIWCEQQYLENMREAKFDILDEVRKIETGEDFPASLSIGVGVGGKTLIEGEESAEAALDLAQGRGGDQAVVKKYAKTEYFGGKLQSMEKSSKGKSRIIGHALKQLIEQSENVFIMGHRYADMDSFGAAMGIYRLCEQADKEVFIVLDEVTETMELIYNQALENDYRIVTSEKALENAGGDSLLVVVDVNRPGMVQCRELLDICEKTVIIDHHRRVEEAIENPVLSYIESYASSASELVAEILQFMTSKRVLLKFEAEALLAGMTIDTDNFGMKTGVRTFEAASWLRRQGADPTEVKRLFQESFDTVKIKALALLKAQIYPGGIAVTTVDKISQDTQIMCAQIADQLLTLRGIRASFVCGRNTEEKTVISARSLGELNVQVIMEKFGGGGHLSVAAAQVSESVEETVSKILEILEVEK